MATRRTKTQNKKPSEPRMYIGRTIGLLKQYTVFQGEPPAYVAKLITENEHISALIVPVSQVQQAKKDMQVKGNILNLHASKLSTLK